MANSYIQAYLHYVFAVQGRQNLIYEGNQEELYKYITGIVTNKGQKLLAVGGMPDHVHVFIGISRSMDIGGFVSAIKSNSSRFINEKKWILGKFHWQEGYGAFSYSRSQIDSVIKYILNQKKHHEKRSFKDEYIELLEKFDVSYDEKYLFDWIE
ncbi:IS200/IS605 family transposase [Desulfonema magnum]|uniref:Transposase IS200-like domain-containing protein n=1 Tax=Desulfonema magnum TaxID=45655 RepID=A0A975BM02_9BACT|nr:IS200/IS605 family transposase [Desulfonema magnum]QTA87921.1 Transposase IS200-like domain-containing protein [Desulfonema magnum]